MRYSVLAGGTAVGMALSAGAGWALTPEETWAHWQAQAEAFGVSLTATSEQMSGEALLLEGVTYSGDWDLLSFQFTLGTMPLTPRGDGTVEVGYPPESSLYLEITPPNDPKIEATLLAMHDGARQVVSEDGFWLTEDSVFPEFSLRLAEAHAGGEPVDITVESSLAAFDLSRSYTTEGMSAFKGDMAAKSLAWGYSFAIPENDVRVSNETRVTGFTGTTELALGTLLEELQADLSGARDAEILDLIGRVLESGLRYTQVTTFEAIEITEKATQPFGYRGETKIGEGTAEVDLNADEVTYSVRYNDLDATVSFPDAPIPPMAFGAGSVASEISVPFKAGEDDAVLKIGIDSLTIDEALWAMVDPTGVIPRVPATLVVDLKARINLLTDLFSAATFDATEPPVEPLSVDLTALRLSAAGADLTGSGAFTFDNTDTTTFPNMPRPEGTASFTLTGGNTLLDKLTEIGLIPQDQVMMVRMMAGMLAVPGDGPDDLRSDVVIDGDGQILINGAPMPF